MSLEDGLSAFKRGRYEEAIALLDAYCKTCQESHSTGSRNYMQAGMALVKSYHAERQVDQAIAQCESFMANDANLALKIWAEKALPTLQQAKHEPEPQAEPSAEPPSTPQPQANIHLLDAGVAAQKRGDNIAAIESLEAYLTTCQNVRSRNYMQAQISRIKAYRDLGQFDRAFQLCEELHTSENSALQSWAAKAMTALQPHITKPSAQENQATEAATTPPIPHRSNSAPAKPLIAPRKPPVRPGVAQPIDNTSTVEISAVPGTSSALRSESSLPQPTSSPSASGLGSRPGTGRR